MNFPTPQKHSGIVTELTKLNERIYRLSIKTLDSFEFIAGQFISLKVSDKNYRSYSISSAPNSTGEFSLLVAAGHDGVGSNYIRNLTVGDPVDFIGPSGRFILPENLANTLIFIATGTGVGPLYSMLFKLSESNPTNNIYLLFGIRDESEIFELERIDQLIKRFKNFNYKICFSQILPDGLENSYHGRVTEHLEIITDAQYFICGNPFMVHEVYEILASKNIPLENIFHEKFTVAKKPIN